MIFLVALSALCYEQMLPILHGQIISIFNAGTGAFAAILSAQQPSFNFPCLLLMCNYTFLSTFLLRNKCAVIKNQSKSKTSTFLSRYNLIYLVTALLDFEGNFLSVSAYKYTTLTSIMLLDSFTLPCVMILSYIFLNHRYTWKHILGTLFCIAGLIITMFCDSQRDTASHTAVNPLLGDLFVICGSIMYACSNVLQESIVKSNSCEEYLGYTGFYGFFIAFIQCMSIEYHGIQRSNMTIELSLFIIGFLCCMFGFITNTTYFLKYQDATLYNLSLLSTDVYSVICSYFIYGQLVHWFYFMAFGFVTCGLYIYHTEKSPTIATTTTMKQNVTTADSDNLYTHSISAISQDKHPDNMDKTSMETDADDDDEDDIDAELGGTINLLGRASQTHSMNTSTNHNDTTINKYTSISHIKQTFTDSHIHISPTTTTNSTSTTSLNNTQSPSQIHESRLSDHKINSNEKMIKNKNKSEVDKKQRLSYTGIKIQRFEMDQII